MVFFILNVIEAIGVLLTFKPFLVERRNGWVNNGKQRYSIIAWWSIMSYILCKPANTLGHVAVASRANT